MCNESFEDLHSWSCDVNGNFWDCIWDFCEIIGDKGERLVEHSDQMPGAAFFPDARDIVPCAKSQQKATAGGGFQLLPVLSCSSL